MHRDETFSFLENQIVLKKDEEKTENETVVLKTIVFEKVLRFVK